MNKGDFVLGRLGNLCFGGKIVCVITPNNGKPEYVVELPCGLYIRTETVMK